MKRELTRRGFIHSAAAGSAALAWLSARQAPSVLAAETGEWRDAMPGVHAAVDQLAADGLVRLSWKGRPLATRAGPYRIAWGGGRR